MVYKAAVIGTGANPEKRDRTGYAMAYRHAPGYERLDNVRLVSCADIVPENAADFAEAFDISSSRTYEDYETMLEEVEPDIVSVCVPPSIHAEVVIGCAESGIPEAIHCEKPMATTWGDCQRMVDACEEADVQFTIDHQRRFSKPFLKAKELVDDGSVGELERIECGEVNLFDAGVHQFDLANWFNDFESVDWVLGNIDYREENLWFGEHNENQGLTQWRYENGVQGIAMTGEDDDQGMNLLGCYMRLVCSDGTIELGLNDGTGIRYRADGDGWTTVDTGDTIHAPANSLPRAGLLKALRTVPQLERVPLLSSERVSKPTFYERAIEEVVAALKERREPAISGRRSLRGTEVTFATWESARQRGRVDLPLDIDDNPLNAMVEAGDLPVNPSE